MWNITLGGTMFSYLGVSFHCNKEEMELRYIMRRLISYGASPTGDLTKDKQTLKKIERGELQPVQETFETKVENLTENTDYKQAEYIAELIPLTEERKGAEQLAILNKLKLGLI